MAGIFLLAAIGVGVFVYSRERDKPPVRFRATVTVQVSNTADNSNKQSNSNRKTTTSAAPLVSKTGVTKLALATTTRQAAIKAGRLTAASGRRVSWGAKTLNEGRLVTLTTTAPTRAIANAAARGWGIAFTAARKQSARDQLTAKKRQLTRNINAVHVELQKVDAKLAKLLPGIYGGVQRLDSGLGGTVPASGNSSSNSANGATVTKLPHLPDGVSTYVLTLALERPQLISDLSGLIDSSAKINKNQASPDSFALVVGQTSAQRVTKVKSTTIPAAGGLIGGLVLGIGLAVLLDRRDRTIRDPRAAAAAFASPVLSLVPSSTDGDYVILSDPMSNTAEAYRGLAATAIATDRLPKAIMVSTPHGDAHEEVAANFAAALSRFGLKVALIATTPDQAWYAERFDEADPVSVRVTDDADDADDSEATPPDVTPAERKPASAKRSTFPELLVAAHAGTLNGQLRDQLASDARAPNLVVVPPSDEAPAQLAVDGLPPLLLALADAGIDITVVSGPALLEDADATIVAWATRCVLWAIVEGEITSTEARAAAARLELAGVVPFGVVMVGHRLSGI